MRLKVHGKSDWSSTQSMQNTQNEHQKANTKETRTKRTSKKVKIFYFAVEKPEDQSYITSSQMTDALTPRKHTHSIPLAHTHTHKETYGIRYGSYGISTHYKNYQKSPPKKPLNTVPHSICVISGSGRGAQMSPNTASPQWLSGWTQTQCDILQTRR